MKLKILGVVPARKGSKGIKDKNLLKIKNKSLVEIAIREAKKSKLIKDISISTDSFKIVKIAKKLKISVPSLRPANLSGDKTNIFKVLNYELDYWEKKNNTKYDAVILLQPTTPFRTKLIIDNSIKYFKKNYHIADSLITITDIDYPVEWTLKKEKIFVRNFFKNANSIVRRQNSKKLFKPNGMIYIVKRNLLKRLKNKILPTKKTLFFYIPKSLSINIDTIKDYLLARIDEKRLN